MFDISLILLFTLREGSGLRLKIDRRIRAERKKIAYLGLMSYIIVAQPKGSFTRSAACSFRSTIFHVAWTLNGNDQIRKYFSFNEKEMFNFTLNKQHEIKIPTYGS